MNERTLCILSPPPGWKTCFPLPAPAKSHGVVHKIGWMIGLLRK
jgi:hypothetical protein